MDRKISAGGSGVSMGVDSFGFKDEHSDDPGERMKLPQANGGVPTKVTSHMTGNSGLMPGERDLGNPAKNKTH